MDDEMDDDIDDFEDIEKNVLGTELEVCSNNPLTGYQRDGYCRSCEGDVDRFQICAVMTNPFLKYTNRQGMDILRPRPIDEDFTGLEEGDRWCVGVDRWIEALHAGFAPPVILEATSEAVLDKIDFTVLEEHQWVGFEWDDG